MNPITYIESDTEIKTMIAQHGKVAHLTPRPNFGPFRYHCVWKHEECIYAVTHYHGYLLPSDNGYAAVIIDQSQVDTETAIKIVQEFINCGINQNAPVYGGIVKDEACVN